ncbi:hypothetical protein C8Q77DRAFT_1061072 [Trametes polyzona]|nr:hypothetical protein C8Q77DRAFT_1061072 [Trametes polyzona]
MALCDDFLPHGSYILMNVKGGIALDLAGKRTRLEGHLLHGEANQRWMFMNTGRGWAIRSSQMSHPERSVYLSVKRLQENEPVVPSTVPISWFVYLVNGALRIHWPHTDYVIELGGCGDSTPGTRIQLTLLKEREPCQLWYFTRYGDFSLRRLFTPNPVEPVIAPEATRELPVYRVLVHTHEDVALELDSTSRKRIKHRPLHKQPSQQWRVLPSGDGQTDVIQAFRDSLDDQPLYLTVQAPAQPGSRVVASPYPVGWKVERCPISKDGKPTLRIFWPGTNLVVSTTDCDGSDNVVLAEHDDGTVSQWREIALPASTKK